MKILSLLIAVILVFTGCTTIGTTPESSDMGSEFVMTASSLSSVTDEELVDAVIQSEALHAWGCMGSVFPESADGIRVLMKSCPEFAELWNRESGLQSLEEYGSQLVEKYMESEDSYCRINAMFMQNLLKYMFPWLENEMNVQ